MVPSHRAHLVGVIGLLCLGCLSDLQGQATLNSHDVLKDAKGTPIHSIEVVSVFERLPLHGFAPLQITITNKTEDEPEWTFQFEGLGNDHRFGSEFTFKARKNSTDSHQLMVPVPTDFSSSPGSTYGRKLSYTAKSNDFRTVLTGELSDGLPTDWPSIAISTGLARGNYDNLKEERKAVAAGATPGFSLTGSEFGARFESASLPKDWRGYSGLDALMMTDKEWQDLLQDSPSTCKAILDWNRFGGRLDIYSDQGLTPYALSIRGAKDGKRSLGTVAAVPWDGRDLDPGKTIASYSATAQQRNIIVDYQKQFDDLMTMFGKRSFGNWQVAVILILFGVLVGPINLFVLAKPGQRHRLFFTTPLISLGASLLLVLLILVQDGTGGSGTRTIVVNVEPSDTSAFVTQYQVSRTGVLFSGAFRAPNTYATLCAMEIGPWASITVDSNESLRYTLDGDGEVFGGDWFQSRREHAHCLKSIRSTRGRIELAPQEGETPTIESSLGFKLKTLYYTDSKGGIWKAPGTVTTGVRVALVKTDGREWEPLVKANSTWVSKDALSQRSSFVALADEAPDFAIESHTGIRWRDHVIVIGPVVGTGTNP